MDNRFFEAVQANPIIAAVKNDDELRRCLQLPNDIHVVFILYGDICNIGRIVHQIKDAGKVTMVHIDLVNGLSGKEIAVDFIHSNTNADGIITTRPNLIRRAKELGLFTILRLFIIDSRALEEVKNVKDVNPDFLEVLPGVIPSAIRRIKATTGLPILAGGLIVSKQDVIDALDAGAAAISATSEAVWRM